MPGERRSASATRPPDHRKGERCPPKEAGGVVLAELEGETGPEGVGDGELHALLRVEEFGECGDGGVELIVSDIGPKRQGAPDGGLAFAGRAVAGHSQGEEDAERRDEDVFIGMRRSQFDGQFQAELIR